MPTDYLYSDWASQPSEAAQLARLNLHIGEVGMLIRPDRSLRDGMNKRHDGISTYYKTLIEQRDRLQGAGQVDKLVGGGRTRVVFA